MDLMHILGLIVTILGMSIVGIVAGGGEGGGGESAGSEGSPSSSGSGTEAGNNGGSPPSGSGATPPVASPESPNIRQLREQYEQLKSQYEPYSKLGKPEEIQSHVSIAQKLTSTAVELGAALGYEEQEIRNALINDPDGTIAFLRAKQAEAQKNGTAPQPDINKIIEKKLQPIMQREEQRQNDEANSRFDSAFDQTIKTLYKDDALDEGERGFLYTVASTIIANVDGARERILSGKSSDIQKAVDEARSYLDKYYLARVAREQKRIGKPANPQTGQPHTGSNGMDRKLSNGSTVREILDGVI